MILLENRTDDDAIKFFFFYVSYPIPTLALKRTTSGNSFTSYFSLIILINSMIERFPIFLWILIGVTHALIIINNSC